MVRNLATFLPELVLLSHLALLSVFSALVLKLRFLRSTLEFIASRSLGFGLALAIVAVSGSLFYSEILSFEPCVLCVWQRIFLFPLLPIFALALYRSEREVWPYVTLLASIAGLIGLYQVFAPMLGVVPLAECLTEGGACDRIYVKEFGYITIPVMSLTVSVGFLLLAWVNHSFNKNK